ncbi:uncharacterized protein LOC129001858 isoform X1 [Macrosteles quadrilineatus]|uniref:uncharacterized protein LOC129001858 isoform X1 n=2 Tax=Macrosteles quadrilineatus TaxID=74068 RepID=UPI0023E0B6A4|nr:uncharacterized protein LOC129001858 isoform X1 [Macrosteles quadrilineatus]
MHKIMQWTARMLDWGPGTDSDSSCGAETLESALRGLRECTLDPRELPRPHRLHDHPDGDGNNCGKAVCGGEVDSRTWCCWNCAQLSSQLLECTICLEPLAAKERRGVTSCVECGNIACLACAQRLPRCPYCRSEPGLVPNLALQRLVYRLDIPCRSSVLPVRCPHKKCEWRGDIDSLATHLEQAHLVTILNGSQVTLDIADFHRKAELSLSRARHYSVLLSCFSDVFVCKVMLYQGKLKVILSQLSKVKHSRIGAWVEISCLSKVTKGIIHLSKTKSEFEVSVTNFVLPNKGSSDRVTISISIRPLC